MTLLASFEIALKALRFNPLRSALTMLGIIIGVGAVIAMIAMGSGAKEQIAAQIRSIGANLILVTSGSTTSGGIRLGSGTVLTLTEDDAKAIAAEVPIVHWVAPSIRGTAQVVFNHQNWSTLIRGTTPEYFEVRDWPVELGYPLTQRDADGATKVALLGQTVVENLFGTTDPLGQIVRIKKIPFTVVGVLARKGQSGSGQDQDDTVIIPLSTAKTKVLGVSQANGKAVEAIFVKAQDSDQIQEAIAEIRGLLRQRHRLLPQQEDDFTVRKHAEAFAAQEEATRTMALLLGALASISLLVGGIGIMNIMLVSVTERTREIGIRAAVGARSREILAQFLVEATTLSSIGGVIGIVLGVGTSRLIALFAGWPILISPEAILAAFLFSAGIGIFFGYYPARKAAQLNPIEALRYE